MSSQAQQPPALVSVDEVVLEPFAQTVPVIGRLVASQNGLVAAKIAGAIDAIMVETGDRVTAGQPIAQIDTRELELQKQQRELQLIEARSRLETARAQLSLASQEVKRLSALQNSAAVSRAAYDDAVQQQAIATARVNEAQAAIASDRTEVELATLLLSFGTVIAPYSGTITDKQTEVGSYVRVGDAVVSLLSDDQLELEADVPYDRLIGIPAGTRVNVRLDNNSRHNASVRAIIPEENPRTRTRRVRFVIEWQSDSGILASEQSATVYIPAGRSRDILSIHKDALIRKGSQTIVYAVVDDSAELRNVKLGNSSGERVEVLDGVSQGDQVVVRGNERLRPGQAVSIANAN
ncbi:MAG: efflux RND transporter periplasmic adaptor subunit [Pseudomonadota bacterium]